MENTIFATVLFLVYFSFACWLITPAPQESRVVTTTNNSLLISLAELRTALAVEPEPDEEAETQPLADDSLSKSLLEIDIETLQLRPARKIARLLEIQQKVNGKDQPLSWLRAQIKKRLEEQPQTTAPIIAEVLNVA